MKVITPSRYVTTTTIVVDAADIIQALNQSGMLEQYIPPDSKTLVRLREDTMNFNGADSIIITYTPPKSNT
ncbi:MAG: hypothetical protein CTY12_00755 [Methylotenera sp.]|nr:MAG: hypothetical protein CTY12_00755 [Methylotenera sp.]